MSFVFHYTSQEGEMSLPELTPSIFCGHEAHALDNIEIDCNELGKCKCLRVISAEGQANALTEFSLIIHVLLLAFEVYTSLLTSIFIAHSARSLSNHGLAHSQPGKAKTPPAGCLG